MTIKRVSERFYLRKRCEQVGVFLPNKIVKQRGVTLVELVAVIVLLGVIGTGLVNFIGGSAEAYREVLRRDEVAQVGRFAIERVSRELRGALPGSVRVSGNCVEFVPVLAASIYTDLPVAGLNTAADSFTVVSAVVPGGASRVVVYTLDANDVYGASAHLRSFDVASASSSAGETTYNFSAPAQQFPEQSPGRRIYFVDTPVSFCVSGPVTARVLQRYSGYGYLATQPSPPAGGALLAEFIQLNDAGVIVPFDYSAGTLQRNAVVQLDFRFLARGTTSEWARFLQDVVLRGRP
ncbi:MAG: type II secretion system GspH family protein [Gammaproteobacteria bacterium]|nr:type II secretion system GspH family protein [Gammaproteobacteria bacterium]